MCGIAGHVNFGSGRADVALVHQMTDALAHRGPDGDGIFVSRDQKVVLGHRRLAILDLSKTGQQPMESPDGVRWSHLVGQFGGAVKVYSGV